MLALYWSTLRSRKADVGVGAVSITSAREREFDFSQPILNAGLQIMVRSQGTDGIKGPEDLSGKRVATTPGSTAMRATLSSTSA